MGRTNKALNIVAVPILYSSIEWAWLEEDRIPLIGFLLCTILNRPDLAAHVKSLTLRGSTFSLPPFTGKKPPLVPASSRAGLRLNDDELESVISQATLDSALADSWIAAAREGRMDALVALLLIHLPQLTTLILETNFAKEKSMIGQVVLHECTSVLQQLQTIKISLETDWDTRNTTIDNTDAVLAMFYLRKIRYIQAEIGNPPNLLKWPGAFTPDSSDLTSLDLYSKREPHLGEILKVTQNLTSLSWLWDYDPDLLHYSPVIDLDAISAALRHVHRTLTHLNISATTSEGDGVDFRRLTFPGSMDGLRDMQCLETLQAPFVFLLGVPGPGAEERRLEDVVPSTLRHLTITQELGMWGCIVNDDFAWDDEDQFEKIASWLASPQSCSSSTRRPYLQSMSLEFGTWSPLEFGLWGVEMQNRLRNLGGEICVDVEIV